MTQPVVVRRFDSWRSLLVLLVLIFVILSYVRVNSLVEHQGDPVKTTTCSQWTGGFLQTPDGPSNKIVYDCTAWTIR